MIIFLNRYLIFSFFIVIFFCQNNLAFAQTNTIEFELAKPNFKVKNGLFSHVVFLDSRSDNKFIGYVHKGRVNKKETIVITKSLEAQIQDVVLAIIDSTAKKDTVLFQLRKLNATEIDNSQYYSGNFSLRANIYLKKDSLYKKIAIVDTTISINRKELYNSLLDKGTGLFNKFIAYSIIVKPKQTWPFLNLAQLKNIDSIEKASMPLYDFKAKFVNGVYITYNAFKMQKPDYLNYTLDLNFANKIKGITVEDSIKPSAKFEPNQFYALVKDGVVYISLGFGTTILYGKGNDYYINCLVEESPRLSGFILSTFLFGVEGGIEYSKGGASASFWELKMDHLNGGFIKIKKGKIKK